MYKKTKFLLPVSEIEKGALDQLKNVCSFDFVKKVAVLPDVHKGYFLPIGTVASVEGHVSPEMVGYDIGCGMCFLDTGIPVRSLFPSVREKETIMRYILKVIPVGYNKNEESTVYNKFVSASGDAELTEKVSKIAGYQVGTLGGGNHFIEIGENQSGTACITVHSGSRNPGHSIAGHYMKSGDFLPEKSNEGRAYIHDMNWAIDYALMNRRMIMYKVFKALLLTHTKIKRLVKNIINENHNTAIKIKGGWLHRKGATPAEKGQLGIIPGNMGDGVAITVGLGNDDYLKSASHGAGRWCSSTYAKKNLCMNDFKERMKDIVSNGIIDRNLHESPGAYKDFEKVLGYQDGVVVKVIDRIKPLINIKG